MSKRHADSTPDEKAPNGTTLSANSVLVEAARNGNTTAVRAVLEKLSPDTDSKTVAFDAVHEACRGNHDECLALLLPHVETTQMGFGMLLSECIHADHTACTEVLLQHWKSVCSNVAFVRHSHNDMDASFCPAMWEDPAVCQVLIDAGADIETKDEVGFSPLHWACRSGELTVVKMLVRNGARVRVIENAGRTCFMFAAAFGHTEIVRYLVDADHTALNLRNRMPDMRDQKGDAKWSALFYAIDQNHADVVKVLIDAGADIELKGARRCSPLHFACCSGKLEVVKMLVRAGADVSVTDNKGHTCLTIAADNGHTETVRSLLCLPEADVNQSDINGLTSLNHAVTQKHSDVVQVLIDAGADVEANNIGLTPLHRACKCGALEIVQMLVEAGADVRVVDHHGITCLMGAAYIGRTETVRYLVGLPEVDVNRNRSGYTALKLARQKKHADVVQVLLEHGAEE